ncbi:MAG: acetoacetate--CoA ligase [Spirochaetes bacterium]|nr:acetoacetate--CoA ligase [Spirochaetota bacterium]
MKKREIIWKPSGERIRATEMYRYMRYVNETRRRDFSDYADLYRWSTDDIPDFWRSIWDFMEVIHSRGYDDVLVDGEKMPGARWFPGATLNFAENLLRYRDERTALVFRSENGSRRQMSYGELFSAVERCAAGMRAMGIRSGDRVAGFMPNMPETAVAMLAAASIGALWSSCSPDFGIKGVLDRFGQIRPRLIFTADGYFYNGKTVDSLDRIRHILESLPSIEKVVVVPYTDERPDISVVPHAVHYADFTASREPIVFEQLPFEHPLYIMYSSGTTGLPKCMVQGAGGILLHQMKELRLHSDLKRDDVIFYFTTCGWMMWNWLVCSLSLGATIVLFDGSPFHPNPSALFKMAGEEKISIFGTSARYIAAIEKENVRPARDFDLSALKALLSTGSPLAVDGFDYVYREIKRDLCLSSISGGTDINGCFALGNPMGPVYRGELQCRGLGMKVESFGEDGKPVTGEKGELVCTAPFPSMPIHFWDDPDGSKYHKAYFDVYPGVWRHGDFIEITESGGVVIYGRSDATLNPGGVRIGTAEIYRQVETIEEVHDSLVVGQSWENDVRVVLFVKLKEGRTLTDELAARIRKTVRDNTTPRHVPAKIIAIDDIPYTINMKKVELAVKNIIEGRPVTNRDALANPQALELYRDLAELKV